jgi:hypothetical protein
MIDAAVIARRSVAAWEINVGARIGVAEIDLSAVDDQPPHVFPGGQAPVQELPPAGVGAENLAAVGTGVAGRRRNLRHLAHRPALRRDRAGRAHGPGGGLLHRRRRPHHRATADAEAWQRRGGAAVCAVCSIPMVPVDEFAHRLGDLVAILLIFVPRTVLFLPNPLFRARQDSPDCR